MSDKDPTSHPAWRSFERGFSTRSAGSVRICPCGRTFYNPDGGWDWNAGELERLAADPKATAVDWGCEEIVIDGRAYAMDCDCWHARGLKILEWIARHDYEIASFLTEEKVRKTAEAERSPVVA